MSYLDCNTFYISSLSHCEFPMYHCIVLRMRHNVLRYNQQLQTASSIFNVMSTRGCFRGRDCSRMVENLDQIILCKIDGDENEMGVYEMHNKIGL